MEERHVPNVVAEHHLRCKAAYGGVDNLGVKLAPIERAGLPGTRGTRDGRSCHSGITDE